MSRPYDFIGGRVKVYRAEYGAMTVAIIGYLAWRWMYIGGLDLGQMIFWALFPDLASSIPIAVVLLLSKRRSWPSWEYYLYNAVHTITVWGLVFGLLWLLYGTPYWNLATWLAAITADRSVGWWLLKRPEALATQS